MKSILTCGFKSPHQAVLPGHISRSRSRDRYFPGSVSGSTEFACKRRWNRDKILATRIGSWSQSNCRRSRTTDYSGAGSRVGATGTFHSEPESRLACSPGAGSDQNFPGSASPLSHHPTLHLPALPATIPDGDSGGSASCCY